MADKRKTHKGQTIDVDLIRMKHELELKEINNINIKREKEIDGKRRRGNSNRVGEMLANQELIKQKLRDQKKKEDPEQSEEAIAEEAIVETKVEKDKPETTGRRIVKR